MLGFEPKDIRDKIDSIKDNNKKIESVKDLIHFLQFEERVLMLSEEEREDLENPTLSSAAIQRIDLCKTKKEKDYYFEQYARSRYIKDRDWASYLNGETKQKPFVKSKKKDCVSANE